MVGSAFAQGFARVPDDLHQRILALLFARPDLVLVLWRLVEPTAAELLDRGWIVRVRDANLRARTLSNKDRHLIADLIITVHPADIPDADPMVVLVVECQLNIDEEPWLRPKLIGRDVIPIVDDHGRAVRDPELAVLSAVFHGATVHGSAVLSAAGLALQTLPPGKRREYGMLIEDALPEEMMDEVRKITQQEAQAAVDAWFRSRGPYVIGHRQGVADGIEQGIEQGREQGRRDGLRRALALVFELRGLVPTDIEQLRIDNCRDLARLERWCQRAKTVARVADLFDE